MLGGCAYKAPEYSALMSKAQIEEVEARCDGLYSNRSCLEFISDFHVNERLKQEKLADERKRERIDYINRKFPCWGGNDFDWYESDNDLAKKEEECIANRKRWHDSNEEVEKEKREREEGINALKVSDRIKQEMRMGMVRRGFTQKMVILAKGYPIDINRTSGAWGVHEQWVYAGAIDRDKREYYYFENGKLMAIQD
jgi:hypothetical protein